MLESWIFPVVICAALVVIIGLLFRKAKRGNGEFDERQELLRAGAHKHAFFTILILAALHSFFVSVLDRPIMEDGFFAVNQKPGSYLLIAGLCVVADGIGSIPNLVSGACVRDGMLTMQCLPLVIGAVFLAVFLTIVWKYYIRKEAEEE